MAKIKSVCGRCSNHCKEGFTIFQSDQEIVKLIEKFPFYKVIKSSVVTVGKTKREYCLLKCDRLKEDGLCESPPDNAPAWCKVQS